MAMQMQEVPVPLDQPRYVNLFQGGSDYMRFVFKRNGIADDSARIGEKMLPHIDKIYGLMEQLAPLEKDRNGLLELMENVESEPAKATVAARLEEFDKQFQAMMSNAYQDLDEAWKAAKADLAEIAQWSPEARANMWMEGPKQRPHLFVHQGGVGQGVGNLIAQQLAVALAQAMHRHPHRAFLHAQ